MTKQKVMRTGKCGAKLTYTVTRTDHGLCVRVSGKGDMADYADPVVSPFYPFRETITEITVERGVTSVGDNAFRGCTALCSLRLSTSVKYLGVFAFAACTGLDTLSLPEGLEIIGPKCFEKCTGLKKIRFPSSLLSVNFKAFSGVTGPLNIFFAGSERQWAQQVRVSPSARGNNAILTAEMAFTDESSRFRRLLAPISRVIAGGGDGRMYIIAPNLTVPDIQKKAGDCTLIVFPDGKTMMIDSGVGDASRHVVAMFAALKLKRLDYFVLTHPHRDHFGGANDALTFLIRENGGSVGTFLSSGFESAKPDEQALYALLESEGVLMNRHVREGDTFTVGGVTVRVFNPDDEVIAREGTDDGTVNNTSVSFRFTYGASSFLTSGDLYENREKELAARYGEALHADIMKANHHGAYTSSSVEWFRAVQPKILLTEEDGSEWTRFDERLKKQKIRNYKVSACGLCVISLDEHQNYRVKTEY